jgi:ABC-type glycerol-3-phosphate transport system permease component
MVATYAVLLFVAMLVLFPMVWMFYTSLKEQREIFANPFSLPRTLNLTNYVEAWTIGNFRLYFLNSIIITLPSVLGALALSSLAAYGFARFKFRGSNVLFLFFLLGIMVPPQAIVIPAFQIVSRLHLMNSFLGLTFTYFSWCSMGIFILRTFFRSIPVEIYDAATIDGAGALSIYWRIALPLAKPALATVAIFYFVWVWNDFIYPLLYLQSDTMSTIPLGLMLFNGKYSVDWGMQTAALSIATIVPIIFYMVFQDKFVKGLTAGAVKG